MLVGPDADKAIHRAGLAAWFRECAPALVLYVRQWVGDRAAAEDVVQELFVRLLAGPPREPHNPRAWLYRAARNAAVAEARSWFRRRRREQAVARERPDLFEAAPGDAVDASAAAAALGRLPADQREAVVLRLWSGLTLAEAAEVAGTSVSTAHARYRAGLEAIKRTLVTSCARTR